MGRQAKARAERREHREWARNRPAPHPEEVLGYLERRGREQARALALNLAAQGGPIVR